MISKEVVLLIHSKLIENYGGAQGVRDHWLLESAINRPFATFDGIDLYSGPIEKAAAILESILINHPFIDGNKRTGYTLARLILLSERYDIKASQDEKYDFVIQVTTGKSSIEEITNWLKIHTFKL
ncbi:MAG: type II toxin-antitoxin system death-on-curing family toxin [Bacteroidota bacterium]|nr:type II toxin-antitoxin system death-on-curing family toxin [Bacteroidota bacterium]